MAYHVGTKLCAWQTYQLAVLQDTFMQELEREYGLEVTWIST